MDTITSKALDVIANELNKPELQSVLKHRIITPLVNLLYSELYPYIMVAGISVFLILLITILSFVCIIFYYLKKL